MTTPTDAGRSDDGMYRGTPAGTPDPTSSSGQVGDVANLPYTFNPPPHPSILHIAPDLSPRSPNANTSIYDETASTYGDAGVFKTLRLGRLVMWEKIFAYAMGSASARYGFRFLYNPASITGSQSVGTDFLPDPGQTINGMLQTGLETINFELLLNRTPEVRDGAKPSDYAFPVSQDELDAIKKRGTHYDIEYLYRVANGIHNTQSRSGTGDIGLLLPQPAELHLGPFRTRGAVVSLSVTDQMFNQNMVPMLSYVQITFSRYLAFTPNAEQLATLQSTGVTIKGSDSSSSSSGSGAGSVTGSDDTAGSTGSNSGQPATGNAQNAPLDGYNIVTTGWKYSDGSPHNGWDYGSAGVKGKPILITRGGEVEQVVHSTEHYGNHVVIRTGTIRHYYCHMERIADAMVVGHAVKPGDVAGIVGSTGHSTGPHLHYGERNGANGPWQQPQWAQSQPLDQIPHGAGPGG